MRTTLGTLFVLFAAAAPAAEPPKLTILFLGDNGHHQPAARFRQLQPVFAARNIELTYTDKLADLNPDTLGKYDGLMVYANHERFTSPEQEKALLEYVASGKGFIPVHCASYCFIDSKPYVDLVGAQFRAHQTGVFRVETAAPDHPVMKGFTSFESWDETYTHTRHNEKDRTVLEYRTERGVKEPWTWVRTPGKGRVFYTAWGHDQRTWSHPGFQNLLERGVRWACGQDPALAGPYVDAPEITAITGPASDFEYVPAKVPFYPAGQRWGVTGEPIGKMQKPLSPEQSMKHYSVPEGFELKLFAADADFGGKPIAMTWDERGRLWVAVTVDYPNERQPEGEGHDKIIICEDTDGDGRADKFTVFADKLSLPTSLLCAYGGVIVHQMPHTLFLKDTDGDGKADVRQVLFTGWGTQDTHAGPSNLHYGFDNWIYGSVGYSGFNGEVNGEKLKFGQGYYRFKLELQSPKPERGSDAAPVADAPGSDKTVPVVTKLEFLRSTNNNTWGLAFSEDGQIFGSTANGCPMVHLAIPNRYYEKVRGFSPGVLQSIALSNAFHPITDKVRQVDWHGGFTAAANCAVYTARTYPPEYWNKAAFVSDPTGHLTATFGLQPAGTDYVARYGWNLVASDDEWAAPIDAQVGPDGNVWLIDWYNFIVQHNPTPQGFKTGQGNAYETPLRDKTHGRVYRLVYTKAPPEPKVDMSDATPEMLVETLKHPNMFWRLHAQRLLVERGQKDVIPALTALVADQATDTTEFNPGAFQAVWTAACLRDRVGSDAETTKAIRAGLLHESPAVRRAALLATDDPKSIIGASTSILDTDQQTRLLRLLRFADVPSNEDIARRLCAGLFLDPTRTPAGLLEWRADFDTDWSPAERDARMIAATVHAEQVFRFLLKYGMAGGSPPDRVARYLETVAKAAAARDPQLAERILANSDHPDIRKDAELTAARRAILRPIFTGFAAGIPAGRKIELSRFGRRSLAFWLSVAEPADRVALLKLATRFGATGLDAEFTEIAKGLLATVADAKASEADRLAAARQVVEFRPDDDAAAAKLLEAVTPQTSPQFAAGVFEALSQSKARDLGPAILAKIGTLPPTARPAALRVVLARPEPTKAFLDAVEAGKLRFDLLDLDQKTALASHPDRAIADRARKLLAQGGGLPDPDRQKVIDQFAAVVKKTGDPAAGRKLFTQHCAKCHKHGGEGQQIGPDLTGFAVHPKEEILIAVLDPSRSVEGNYRTYTAKTIDGRVITGLLAGETKTTVELLDAENKRHALNRDDLDEFRESQKSLMPEGFEKQMSADDLANLLEFLTQKGKYVPLPLDKAATAVSTRSLFVSEDATAERLVFRDWGPKEFTGVPFVLVDPQKDRVKNVIVLHSDNGPLAAKMPKSAAVPCNTAAKAIHLLSGVGGWAYPYSEKDSVSLIVRLHYADGQTEDHELKNGEHFADYIRRVDVPGSKFAFALRGQQIRYLAVTPKRSEVIKQIEFVKGPDRTAPVVMAVTVETP
jgi:putative membrane-bound dehydrogenase-like protein